MTQIGEFQTLFKEFKIIKIKNTLNSENTRLIKKMDNFEKFWILISPVFSSFFASSKFFLNLFAACLIFTEVLELVFYYFSYSWVQLSTVRIWTHVGKTVISKVRVCSRHLVRVQSATWLGRVIFVRLYDVENVRQISRIYLGHVQTQVHADSKTCWVPDSYLPHVEI